MHALIASRNANSGLLNCRQLFFGLFDQCIHTRAEADTEALLRHYHLSVMRVPMTPETNFAASFGHMCGYDAQVSCHASFNRSIMQSSNHSIVQVHCYLPADYV